MKKPLFKNIRHLTAEPAFSVNVYDDKGKWLMEFIADYRLSNGDDNIDLVLDLYNLNATVRHITVNSITKLIEFSVVIKRSHPLFKYSVWSEEV